MNILHNTYLSLIPEIVNILILLRMYQDKENFNVSWHNYSEHLRDMLDDMSSDDSFAYVTLVTDDKKQLKAHRNILSSSSSVFKEILQINTRHSHPEIKHDEQIMYDV